MNIRKNEGITMVSLVVTIIVMLIIAGISVGGAIRGHRETEDVAEMSELNMVQHIILERYTKTKLTKEDLPGTSFTSQADLDAIIDAIELASGEEIQLKDSDYSNYKRLNQADLEDLGISKEEDIYIVNYKTGEVINETKKITNSGKVLYIYSVDGNSTN